MEPYQYSYDFPIPLAGDRAKVFQALVTEEALLQWFAEHVQVEPHEGGAFRFWGRHTIGNPQRNDVNQRIVAFKPGETLAFSWWFMNRESTVILNLRDDVDEGEGGAGDKATRILVEHHFRSLPDIDRAAELVDDMWRLYTGSLLEFMKGKDIIYRPDYADPEPKVFCELMIDASPATVFRVLTEPEQIKKWFPAPAPVVDPRVGGQYGFGFSYESDGQTVEPPPCTILEFEQDRKLSITWPDWRGDPSVADQTVTWQLEDLGDGRTRLVLRHDGFGRTTDVSDYPFGWQHFMLQVKGVAHSLEG